MHIIVANAPNILWIHIILPDKINCAAYRTNCVHIGTQFVGFSCILPCNKSATEIDVTYIIVESNCEEACCYTKYKDAEESGRKLQNKKKKKQGLIHLFLFL